MITVSVIFESNKYTMRDKLMAMMCFSTKVHGPSFSG